MCITDCVVAGSLRPVWIELCQKARVDPHELVSAHADALLARVLQAIDVDNKVGPIQTSYRFDLNTVSCSLFRASSKQGTVLSRRWLSLRLALSSQRSSIKSDAISRPRTYIH